jgi:predicted nuclease with TOPRIM domain
MNFSSAPEFEKELKQLSKKWRSLPDDIEYVKPRIEKLYKGDSLYEMYEFRNAFFNGKRATVLNKINDDVEVVKMRLDVESLGSSDKVRIIFIAIYSKDEIKFIEIYPKNEKSREDQQRIKRYL